MLVYFILLAAAVVFGIPLCIKECGRWGRAVYCAVFAALFTFIAAARFQVGYDYNLYGGTYFNMLYQDIDGISEMRMEKGFLMPLYILNLAWEDYWVVFIWVAILIYPAVFTMIYKNSSCPWISVCGFLCFGLFFNSMCFMRQFIAAVVLLYAMEFIGDRFPWRFFVLVIAASSIHWSALLMLVLYFLLRIKPCVPYLIVMTVLTVLFCLFSRKAMLFFIDNFYMYSGYDPDTSYDAVAQLSIKYTIMFGLLFVLCFVFRKRLMEKNPKNGFYINCLMFTVIFEAMGTRHAVLSRFAELVHIPPLIYLLPDLVAVAADYAAEKKGKVLRGISYSAMAVFAAGSYVMLMLSNYNGVIPYTFQWDRSHDIFVEVKTDEYDEDLDEYDEEAEDGYIDEETEDDYNDEEGEVGFDEEEIIIESLP